MCYSPLQFLYQLFQRLLCLVLFHAFLVLLLLREAPWFALLCSCSRAHARPVSSKLAGTCGVQPVPFFAVLRSFFCVFFFAFLIALSCFFSNLRSTPCNTCDISPTVHVYSINAPTFAFLACFFRSFSAALSACKLNVAIVPI